MVYYSLTRRSTQNPISPKKDLSMLWCKIGTTGCVTTKRHAIIICSHFGKRSSSHISCDYFIYHLFDPVVCSLKNCSTYECICAPDISILQKMLGLQIMQYFLQVLLVFLCENENQCFSVLHILCRLIFLIREVLSYIP